MKKEDIKIGNIKSFSYKIFKDENSRGKTLFLGYNSKNNLTGILDKNQWNDFVYDLINHVHIDDWKKSTSNSRKKDEMNWEIILTSNKNEVITFAGYGGYPKEENGSDYWSVLLQLLDIIETKQKGDTQE
jgi:hypothetical protein